MLPKITQGMIRQHASEASFRRGEEYCAEGAVISLARRGDVLEAEVEGSQPWPYDVRIEFDGGGIFAASCSCPYDWGDWCKHVVAVLLTYIAERETITERPTVESLLSGLDRNQLQTLLLKLVESDPSLANQIEEVIPVIGTAPAAPVSRAAEPQPRHTPLDTASFRTRVQSIFRSVDYSSSSRATQTVSEAVRQLGQVLGQASSFIEAGDGRTAIAILDPITEEYLEGWESLDDSFGEASGFFRGLGQAWARAFLIADLSSEERETWSAKLCEWCGKLEGYGLDDAFDAALQAIEQGWDYPALLAVLRGEFTEEAGSKLKDLDWSDTLTSARLDILERQGKHQEYLNLAKAAGRIGSYTLLLVKLGRIDEAVEEGLRSLTDPYEALALAKKLREVGALEGALRIGERGLDLQGQTAYLAEWLLDVASGMGNAVLALRAALVVFREKPGLAAYLRVQELAADRWPAYRSELLAYLQKTEKYFSDSRVDVFLHEGLIEDAIALVEKGTLDSVVEKVTEAAMASHPDWVIWTCRRYAESIMDGAKAQRYDEAVNWLAKARKAYHASGRQTLWRQYRQELLGLHGRKHKLVPMLKALKD